MDTNFEKQENRLKAIVVDMSGVLANTDSTSRAAWESVFKDFFKANNSRQFFSSEDYDTYIKDKPKYHRVKNFLNSKNISLPFGDQNDSAGNDSACSVENKKMKVFKHLLEESGMQIYENAVKNIKLWKEKGLKAAVVSSDETFKKAFDSAQLSHLFEVKIDGTASRKLGLKEKPEADLYLEATKRLELAPESCIFFDDTVSGLQAGSKANFGLVIGVNRGENRKLFSENGADMVIESFDELDLFNDPEIEAWFSHPIPRFASEYVKIGEVVFGKTPVLFLDYDGTLTPIVQRPEDAVLSTEMQEVLKECASMFAVAAVSGRDMDDLRSRINIDNLIYAGSHGFRISGPDGMYMEHEKSQEILPELNKMEDKLNQVFHGTVSGVQVERKRYAIAIHYRNAQEEDIPFIKKKVSEIVENSTGFKAGEGKKILEIKPDIEWHKGKAVLWILEKLKLTDKNKYIPIYIGDDVTDEDAYESLKDWGIGIQVGPGAKPTAARFRLKNVYQVRIFLKELVSYQV